MNSTQLKILIIKILPRVIFLSIKVAFAVIVLGYLFLKIFFINPENQKIRDKTEHLQIQNKTLRKQPENIANESAVFNKLYIPLDGWSVLDTGLPEKYKNGVMSLKNKNEDFVGLLCIIHDYNTEIHDYSKYQNKKLIKNMSLSGMIFTSKFTEDIAFNNIDSVKETYDQV
jgi:hypothetical protein